MDFTMIANMFPENIDRMSVKKKYLQERKADAKKIDAFVAAKEPVSMEEYSELTSMEFEDPEKLMKELEEEEKRLRDEDEKRRQEAGFVHDNDEADVPIPTTERDDVDEADTTAGEGDDQAGTADEDTGTPVATHRIQAPSTARSERIDALAQKVVQPAVAPKKKQQRRTRESTGTGRGRGGKKGRRAVEGVEERIGPLDEVER